jgi:uncharacterized membrane protein YdjX (TVP38/TMEM64 family)
MTAAGREDAKTRPGGTGRPGLARLWPLAALALGLGAFFALGLHRHLGIESLAEHRAALASLAAARPVLAAAAFVLAYAAATALSVPGASVLTLAGGLLFGAAPGAAYAVAGATLGAVGVFLAARSALGGSLRRRAGPWLDRFAAGFRDDAFSYLLVLRLVPLFPFWLVNLVPAFLGVRLGTFALATLVGIVPGTLVYASVGAGLGAVLDAGRTPDLGVLLRPQVLLPLLGLAALALVPVAYRRFGRRETARGTPR